MSSNKKIIRVLHVINCMDRAGAETFIMNLYRNIDRSKIQFDFLLHSKKIGDYETEINQLGGRIFRVPHYKLYNSFSYRYFINKFFKCHPEYSIVHGHIGSCSHIYLKTAKKYGSFTIAHCHSSIPYKKSIKDCLYLRFSKKTSKIADYFLSCCQEGAEYRYGKQVTNNKSIYKIVNNAIDLHKYKPNKNAANLINKEFNLSKGDVVVGHVGSFSEVKNHKFIIDVFRNALSIQDNLKLILVGDGKLLNNIKSIVDEYNITSKVIFTGVRSDVNIILQRFDCFLFPSFREGVPLSLIEAQASHVPCVISDTISNDSVIDGDTIRLSLKDPVEKWSDSIFVSADRKKHSSFDDNLLNKFDVKPVTEEIANFYLIIDNGSGNE